MEFRYCSFCRGILKKQSADLFICQECSFPFYINAKPTNAIILENERGEILLTRRKYLPKKGYWDLPGGFLKLNETFEESLRREIKEELGVSIVNFSYFSSYHDRYLYRGVNYYKVICTFMGKIRSQPLTPADDVAQIKFSPVDKIPFGKLAFKSIKQSLQEYILRFHREKNSENIGS